MNELFKAEEKLSAVDVVIERIKSLLIYKKIVPGDKLPNEAEIAKGLCVGRGSVREAMKILSAFGVVEIRRGDGTYIVDKTQNSLMDPLLFSFIVSNPNIDEVGEFRSAIELNVIELIIKNKGKNDLEIEKLRENIRQLKKLKSSNAPHSCFAQNDIEFHRLLGECCQNPLLSKIYDFSVNYIENAIYISHQNQTYGSMSYDAHSKIMASIDNNDTNLARIAVNESIETWKKLTS